MAEQIDFIELYEQNQNTNRPAPISPYGEYLTPQTYAGDPFQSYAAMSQQGLLPQGFAPQATDYRSALPAGTFLLDEDGRTTYELPTVNASPTDVSPNAVAEYLGTGSRSPQQMSWKEQQSARISMAAQRKNQQDEFNEVWDDIETVKELGPDNAKNIRNIAVVALRSLEAVNKDGSKNKDAQELGQYILHLFRDYEPFKLIFEKETNGNTQFEDVYKEPPSASGFMKLVGWAFDAIDQPLQTVFYATRDMLEGDIESAGARLVKGGLNAAGEIGDLFSYWTLAPLGIAKALGMSQDSVPSWVTDPVSSLTNPLENMIRDSGAISDGTKYDTNSDGRLDFFEAWGINPDWGKDLGWKALNLNNVVNLAGSVAMDPITYLTLGTGVIAKTGIKGAARIVTSLSKKQLDDVFINSSKFGASQGSSAASRAGEIVAELQNGTAWKKIAGTGAFNPADDAEILKTLLRANKGLDNVNGKVGSIGKGLDNFMDEISKRQARVINRRAERVMSRAGGGLFITVPGAVKGGNIGLKDYAIPFTRSLAKAGRNIRGTNKATWSYVTQYVPRLVKGKVFTGATSLKNVRDRMQTSRLIFDEFRNIEDWTNFPELRLGNDKVQEIFVRAGGKMGNQALYNSEAAQKEIFDFLVESRLLDQVSPGVYKPVADYSVIRASYDQTIAAIDDAMIRGATDVDGFVTMYKEGAEWKELGIVDELSQLTKAPNGGPEGVLQKINYQTRKLTGLHRLSTLAEDFRTFSKAEGVAGASTVDELRHWTAGAKRSAEFSKETIKEIITTQAENIVKLIKSRLPEKAAQANDIFANVVDAWRITKRELESVDSLKAQLAKEFDLPADVIDEIGTFVDSADYLAIKYNEINKALKGDTEFSSIDPMQYIPRVGDSKIADNVAKWLESGGPGAAKALDDLSDPEAVARYLMESKAFRELVEQGVVTVDQAKKGIASFFSGFSGTARQAEIARKAFTEMDSATALTRGMDSTSRLRARAVLPEVLSVIKVNEILSETLKAAGKNRIGKDPEFLITKFYDIDPVDQWLRYAREMEESYLLYDFVGDLENVKVFGQDVAGSAGKVARPASVMGKIEEVVPEKGRTFYNYTYTVPNSFASGKPIKRTIQVYDLKNIQKQVSEIDDITGYSAVSVGNNVHFIDTDILDAIQKDILPAVKSGYTQTLMGQYVNDFQTVWSAYATVPVIGGTGYHSRNWGANMFMMTLAGMRNPKYIGQAIKLQHANAAVHSYMKTKYVLNYDQAVKELVELGTWKGDLKTAANFDKQVGLRLKQLNHTGVLSQSFFADMKRDQTIFRGIGQSRGIKDRLVDNAVIRTGQKMGTFIEDNSRIALYLDGIDSKALNAMESATRVREFLFDYSDLTAKELFIKSKLSRFYTFMRKNLDLQVRLLASNPGSVINTQKAVQTVTESFFGEDNPLGDQPFLPDWIKDSGWSMVNRNFAAVRFETPFIAAMETMQNLASVPQLVPFVDQLFPPELQGKDPSENWRNITQLMAGGVQSAVTYGYDEIHGRSSFSGAILNPDWESRVLRFVGAGLPAVIKSAGMLEKFGVFNAVGFDNIDTVASHQEIDQELANLTKKEKLWIRAMNVFGGVQTYMLDTQQQMRLIAGYRTEFNKIMKELQEAGEVDILTMEDLRTAGNYSEADRFFAMQLYSADPISAENRAASQTTLERSAEYYGINIPEMAANSTTDEERMEDVQVALQIFESMINRGRDESLPRLKPTDEDILAISLSHPSLGLPNEVLGTLGIAGFHSNVFEEETETNDRINQAVARTALLFENLGIPLSRAQNIRPYATEAERIYRDGQEKGMTTAEIVDYIFSTLSRRQQQSIFGVDSLDMWTTGKGVMTKEEAEKANAQLKEDAFMYMALAFSLGVRPTPADIYHYLAFGTPTLNQGQRESLGLPLAPKTIQAEDARSPQLNMFQTLLENESIAQAAGLTQAPQSLFPQR